MARSSGPDRNQLAIPPGTILPIRLGSLSSEKRKPGDPIKARIMQDVPLGNGSKLRARSKSVGNPARNNPSHPPRIVIVRKTQTGGPDQGQNYARRPVRKWLEAARRIYSSWSHSRGHSCRLGEER